MDQRMHLAVIDSDSGFVQVLTKRMSGMGWQYRTLASPVPPAELVAMRINCLIVDLALLGPQAWDYLERVAGEMEIRGDQYQAFVGGQSLDLTRREFELLQLLADAAGQVLQREEIYQRVWGYAMAHGDRSVDVFVRKPRQKLEQASPMWRYIHTHFGIGYRFAAEFAGHVAVQPAPAAAVE